ncbi:unnamed protein product [Prorocentrum cordatum]|uniref:Uncharacterized protein n=1 Tax=Prorocentrum cordatum TaxID=2364126 RepID=A0ABN9UWY4_9DINO|nr:unnamed protein product [Polarella glacialis]
MRSEDGEGRMEEEEEEEEEEEGAGGRGKGGEEGRSVRGWRPATTGLPRGRRSVACRMMPPETRRRRTIIFCTGSDGARLRLMRSSCFMKTECYKACSLSNRRF